jgi:hypothetical protein
MYRPIVRALVLLARGFMNCLRNRGYAVLN